MKLTNRQKGKLKTLVHNIVKSEQWQFAVLDILKGQKNSLGSNITINKIVMELKIDIENETNVNKCKWYI